MVDGKGGGIMDFMATKPMLTPQKKCIPRETLYIQTGLKCKCKRKSLTQYCSQPWIDEDTFMFAATEARTLLDEHNRSSMQFPRQYLFSRLHWDRQYKQCSAKQIHKWKKIANSYARGHTACVFFGRLPSLSLTPLSHGVPQCGGAGPRCRWSPGGVVVVYSEQIFCKHGYSWGAQHTW